MTDQTETTELLREASRLLAENMVESLRREREMRRREGEVAPREREMANFGFEPRWLLFAMPVLVTVTALTSFLNLIVVLAVHFR